MSEKSFEQMLEESLKVIHTGEVVDGTVISVKEDSIVLNIGYKADGIMSRSDYSSQPNLDLRDVVKVGDVLEVFVKDLDKENNRISLGYKKDEDNPWVKFANSYNVGDVVDAEVVSITPFGAFAQIIPGIDGLIHISQLANKRVTNVKDVVSVGDKVKAKITEIDVEKKRISMSIRELLEEEVTTEEAAE